MSERNPDSREYTMTATVYTDARSAQRLREAFELVAAVLCAPTEENTSALFHLAAESLVARAQSAREIAA